MDTLTIKTENALKAYTEANLKGKNLLENLFGKKIFLKDIKDRVKTLADAIDLLGAADEDVIDYHKMVIAGVSEHILGNQQLIIIAKALNEGWVPDWSNGKWDKWFPWFWLNNDSGSSSASRFSFCYSANRDSLSDCGSRLCFKSKELADYAASQFIDIYQKTFII